jgi:hypothetical protein
MEEQLEELLIGAHSHLAGQANANAGKSAAYSAGGGPLAAYPDAGLTYSTDS